MGGIVVPINVAIQRREGEVRLEVQRSAGQIQNLHLGYQVYEGTRIYGIDYEWGGKKWELSMSVNNPDIKAVHEGILHMLDVALKDIREKLSS